MSRCLFVIGSSGLVGSEMCIWFAAKSWEVHGLDNNQRAVFFGFAGDTRWNQARLEREVLGFVHHEIDVRDRRGATPLMHAAAFGNLETLKLLLDAGADVNARNEFNATALLWASGQPEKARLLMKRGAEVNIQSRQGRTPLMVAAAYAGNAEVVRLMLSKGADAKARTNRHIGWVWPRNRRLTVAWLPLRHGDRTQRMWRARRQWAATPRSSAHSAASKVNVAIASQRASLRTVNNIKNGPLTNSGVIPSTAAFGLRNRFKPPAEAGANVNARDGRQLFRLRLRSPVNILFRDRTHAIQAGADERGRHWRDSRLLRNLHPSVIAELKRGRQNGRAYSAPQHQNQSDQAVALERATRLWRRRARPSLRKRMR
jgi:ankyrin repeat protein